MTTSRYLAGNGIELVRERALACAVQQGLCRLYRLDALANVDDFVEPAESDGREVLLVREAEDGVLEMSLRLAPFPPQPTGAGLDALCQVIEGVSHFVYLSHRAHEDRRSTQLELELQAEVDKYVVLASAAAGQPGGFNAAKSEELRRRLYDEVSFSDVDGSLLGERYRVANDTAQRFVRRLENEFVAEGRYEPMRHELRRFYSMGQEEKLRAAR